VYARASDVFNAPYDTEIETLLPTVNNSADLAKLPGGTPLQAMHAMFKPAYLADLASNPANGAIMAAKKQDLFGWNPKAPTTLCAAKADPVVKFFNAQMAFDDFASRGLTNVSLVDVDAKIAQTFGSVLATDPISYFTAYHATYEAQFCNLAARRSLMCTSRRTCSAATSRKVAPLVGQRPLAEYRLRHGQGGQARCTRQPDRRRGAARRHRFFQIATDGAAVLTGTQIPPSEVNRKYA